jgi:hypothetical protein
LAQLRLQRAAARAALGLTASAAREAGALAADPGATPAQRAEALAIQRQLAAPVQTAAAPGPITVEAALAVAQREVPRPIGCEVMEGLAADLGGPAAWPIHEAASACARQRGDAVTAWREGMAAGLMGRIARLGVTSAGHWEVLDRMDQDGGTRRITLARVGPDESDGLYAVARETALGVPWPESEYSVLRGGHTAGLAFTGEGDLELLLVCRDEAFSAEPPPCSVRVAVDGVTSEVVVPEAALVRWRTPLVAGAHRVQVAPRDTAGQALVVRAAVGGELLPPRLEVTAHLVGAEGARATIAGGNLVRVRVLRGGPVQVLAQGQHAEVDDLGVFALTGSGPVLVGIEGPADAAFTIARLVLHPTGEDLPPAVSATLESTDPEPVAPDLTRRWMREVAVAPTPVPRPPGRGGTTAVWAEAGDDATGVRDERVHYPYLGTAAGWSRRIDGTRHWVEARGLGRLGLVGAPGAHLDGAWTWAPRASRVALALSLGASGGTGHAAVEGDARRRLLLGPWWELRPRAGVHFGHVGPRPSEAVDPLAWSDFAADHRFGFGLGADADWRPLRDARLRLSADLDTNPDATLDRLETAMRLDALVLPSTTALLGARLGYRFADDERAEAYVRPALQLGLGYAGYARPTVRWDVRARADWLLPSGGFEGWLRFGWEWSAARGLLDHEPDDLVFSEALDLPLGPLGTTAHSP